MMPKEVRLLQVLYSQSYAKWHSYFFSSVFNNTDKKTDLTNESDIATFKWKASAFVQI